MMIDRESYAPAGHVSACGPPRARHSDETPLEEFAWSDAIVGLGFFPHELALPAGWTWASQR